MTTHDFYFVHISNYGSKSIAIQFGYTNEKGKQKKSVLWFIPKKAVTKIDFGKGVITIKHWYLKLNGFAWRYRTDKAFAEPNYVNIEIWSFYDNLYKLFYQSDTLTMPSLEGIELVL
jgi:hypothetical protein